MCRVEARPGLDVESVGVGGHGDSLVVLGLGTDLHVKPGGLAHNEWVAEEGGWLWCIGACSERGIVGP